MRFGNAIVGVAWLAAAARGEVTTAQKTIGEPGGFSCCGPEDPPTLCDGVTPATASVEYRYDDAAHTLTLVVANTSPVEPGIPNPLLTSLYFNAPPGAVTGLSLLAQSGSGGAAPEWTLVFDPNPKVQPKPAKLGCLGAFSARLTNGPGIAKAIANAAAGTFSAPPGSWVVGPATFVLQVTEAAGARLDASDFANAFSHNPPGVHQVNVGAHFQAGGPQGKSGKISASVGCEPGAFLTGSPTLGGAVTLVMSGAPGCCGCFAVSDGPGPILVPNIPGCPPVVVPLTLPIHVLIATTPLTAGTTVSVTIPIPNDPNLLGATFFFAAVLVDPDTGKLFGSTGSSVTIAP
ncbi:MAG TPA: hypothetical protein VFI25_15135 [Planctomycetota bacterium]|jgi:hypothetical protein|nr:hypothetical protein [Planctomycetota bacterium]